MKPAAVLAAILAFSATAARGDALDDLFARYKTDTPGCAVGVARPGQPAILRAYGMAELEHAIPIKPDTIFEAGSVSKQFTAAAILTLVADGKIALGDDIRKYVPEMTQFAMPITVDMLLSHTSGLRDWGEVEAVAGWPRSSRIYTHDEVLQIAARQKSLNYTPGTAYSYTNTGYNLAAIIVKRVSGQSLADFTAERLFKPLGMTRTGWRDDFRRVVPGRAQAYDKVGGRYALDMPFENVHGNSSLLTTVGDLLIWNQALADRKLGAVGDQLQQQAVLTNGRKIDYARGLFVQTRRGVPEVNHSGATAGYRAWLSRYPSEGLSVAILCNAGDADGSVAGKVADLYLTTAQPTPPAAKPLPPEPANPASPLARHVGLYILEGPLTTLRLQLDGDRLRVQGGPPLEPTGPGTFRMPPTAQTGAGDIRFRRDGDMIFKAVSGETRVFQFEVPYVPTAADLASLVGTYASEEAGATVVASIRADRLLITPSDRPSGASILNAAFKDGFFRPGGLVRFERDSKGKVIGFRYIGGRVWDLRFRKVG